MYIYGTLLRAYELDFVAIGMQRGAETYFLTMPEWQFWSKRALVGVCECEIDLMKGKVFDHFQSLKEFQLVKGQFGPEKPDKISF